ncbi:hypothetical protein GCM10010409_04480 [Mycolicibacterium diernhoferi]|uniref:Uncharacterized protein n=1 Tax=Mycolicibacterium diernhoferi TaxID=1801 RepID=A0A1Q4HCF0_9MYCO|nr:hypothetical protein BRW64_14485 [Mycolicibacterium diernhoferi]PEG52248.1 hypothetical protein CRI78_22255 [Mycolicibacterium diernhoferi]
MLPIRTSSLVLDYRSAWPETTHSYFVGQLDLAGDADTDPLNEAAPRRGHRVYSVRPRCGVVSYAVAYRT